MIVVSVVVIEGENDVVKKRVPRLKPIGVPTTKICGEYYDAA